MKISFTMDIVILDNNHNTLTTNLNIIIDNFRYSN
jgi:hypothetical protein